MPTTHHVERARKDYPEFKIKKGEPYYWWKFRHCAVCRSATPPTRSQLTRSRFLGAIYDIEDSYRSLATEDLDITAIEIRVLAIEVADLGDECDCNRDNIPKQFQDGNSGQLLRERSGRCGTLTEGLDDIADELEQLKTRTDEMLELFSKWIKQQQQKEAEAILRRADWDFE